MVGVAKTSTRQHVVPGRAVFYLSGIFGDEPKQAMLRERLGARIRLIAIKLPDLESPISVLCSLPETGRLVAEEILRLQQQGEIYIVGFSFGASLALEVAHQITCAGRTIAYLGLIDGPLKVDDRRYSVRGLVQLLLAPRGLAILANYMVQKSRILYKKKNKESTNLNAMNRIKTSDYRFIALREWIPKQYGSKGLIILSITFFERYSACWKALCPNCRQIKVRSDHHNVIVGSSLHRVASALADDIAEYLGAT